MNFDVIENRLNEYAPKTKLEQINAFKEICQEIALSGLARSEFFKKAAFQGGTCLRILYGIKRFSEDLDFILLSPNKNFEWSAYLNGMEHEFQSFGLSLEITNRSVNEGPIKRAFLKENSFSKILSLRHKVTSSDQQVVKIKLEIDIDPPQGSLYETKYIDYPYPFSVLCQDGMSLFSSKCHSILCRKFTKGRDWFDFFWYISRKMKINFDFLKNALFQSGPYKNQKLQIDKKWLIEQLRVKINELNYEALRLDIVPFLREEDQKYIANWNKEFFLSSLKKLDVILS